LEEDPALQGQQEVGDDSGGMEEDESPDFETDGLQRGLLSLIVVGSGAGA
jgi:hypothetical protein